jgi:hypothetical protein
MFIAGDQFEDRAVIHDLFTRYCCALDNGEVGFQHATAPDPDDNRSNWRSAIRDRRLLQGAAPAVLSAKAAVLA